MEKTMSTQVKLFTHQAKAGLFAKTKDGKIAKFCYPVEGSMLRRSSSVRSSESDANSPRLQFECFVQAEEGMAVFDYTSLNPVVLQTTPKSEVVTEMLAEYFADDSLSGEIMAFAGNKVCEPLIEQDIEEIKKKICAIM